MALVDGGSIGAIPSTAGLAAAADFVRSVAVRHPRCIGCEVGAIGPDLAELMMDWAVDLPSSAIATGESATRVRAREAVHVRIGDDFPWTSPTFRLRTDFPRDLPHINPDPPSLPPRPCLVDGSQEEYFLAQGSAAAGTLALLDQLDVWLSKAAQGTLDRGGRGWQPAMRDEVGAWLTLDRARLLSVVDRAGGSAFFGATYSRFDAGGCGPLADRTILLESDGQRIALPNMLGGERRFSSSLLGGIQQGTTVVAMSWPDKLPDGADFVADSYLPDTVSTMGELEARAGELGCARGLEQAIGSLERAFAGVRGPSVPAVVVLCARRPEVLEGEHTDVELLGYAVELDPAQPRASLFAAGADTPVVPVAVMDALSPDLARRVSGVGELPALAALGCGSLGSKMAVHHLRAGGRIASVADQGYMRPHNHARHALLPSDREQGAKAALLAREVEAFGWPVPRVEQDGLVPLLRHPGRASELMAGAAMGLNTTASSAVREGLSALDARAVRATLYEAGLFAAGRAGFLLGEGTGRNPTHSDLMAELYARAGDGPFGTLMRGEEGGLREVAIGQGCSSLTMPMTDARLSAMAAGLWEELVRSVGEREGDGIIVTAVAADGAPGRTWQRWRVPAFTVVPVAGAEDWTVRVSDGVLRQVEDEIARYPREETGGRLMGVVSERLRTFTVVQVLPAPDDSSRSRDLFVLGTEGESASVREHYEASGGALLDLGTWHNHLSASGPSARDWETAAALAAERLAPSVMLVFEPDRLLAISGGGTLVGSSVESPSGSGRDAGRGRTGRGRHGRRGGRARA